MSLPTLYGSLASPEIVQQLAVAQEHPERWTVYLVPERGDQRTVEQNRLLRRAAQELAIATGKHIDRCKDEIVERFLGYEEVVTEDGEVFKRLVSTATLTVPQFSAFLYQLLPWVESEVGHAVTGPREPA